MLEVRYNTITKEVTGWCGDEKQFGHLERAGHTVVFIDIPIPHKPTPAYLYDDITPGLIDNPDYSEPPPTVFNRLNPIEGVEPRLTHIEEWLEEH